MVIKLDDFRKSKKDKALAESFLRACKTMPECKGKEFEARLRKEVNNDVRPLQ